MNSLDEIKNRQPGINSKQEEAEEHISHLGDRVMKSNQAEQMRGAKNTQNGTDPGDSATLSSMTVA